MTLNETSDSQWGQSLENMVGRIRLSILTFYVTGSHSTKSPYHVFSYIGTVSFPIPGANTLIAFNIGSQ